MQDKQIETNPIHPSSQEAQMQQTILSSILSLPLTPNQRKIAEAKVNYAVSDFPNNPRAAYLFAKKGCYQITDEELRELEPYCFFPEEHPSLRQFIKERKTLNTGVSTVEVVNRSPDEKVVLDELHMRTIEQTLTRVANRTPQLARHLLKIFLLNKKEVEKEEYAPNGELTKRQCDDSPTGIVLTQLGYRIDISHRITGITNLEGTIAHELGHFISFLYPGFVDKFKQI